jgi:hypothetical protein
VIRSERFRGDGPALDDVEVVVHQAPLDVPRAAEVRLDPPAQLSEPYGLRIRQCSSCRSAAPRSHFEQDVTAANKR